MLVPDQVRVEQMEGLAKEVMQFSRDTLAVKLRFLNPALSRLELLPSTWPLATDGVRLLYDPVYVLHAYAKERTMPVRSYLHVVLHCVFQHFYVDLRIDQTIWNLACDMAVEAMITEMGLDCARVEREQGPAGGAGAYPESGWTINCGKTLSLSAAPSARCGQLGAAFAAVLGR